MLETSSLLVNKKLTAYQSGTISLYKFREKLLRQRQFFFDYGALLHVITIILVFFMAKIETNDAVEEYQHAISTKETHAHDQPNCDLIKYEHKGPRMLVQYCGVFLTILCSYSAILTALCYRNCMQIVCVTNSAHPNTSIWAEPDSILAFLIECSITLIHPVPYIKTVNFCTWPSLYFVVLLRIPILFRLFYLKSPLLNNTTNEIIACLNDIHMTNAYLNNISTACKVAGKKWTYQIFFLHTVLIWFFSAWLLSLAEARHGLHECILQEIYYHLEDMLWLVPVTMMTVGYGDISPKSGVGKIICIFVGFYGLLNSARMVVIHCNKTKMSKRERIVYNHILTREMQAEVKEKAATFIQRIWRERRKKTLMDKLKGGVNKLKKTCGHNANKSNSTASRPGEDQENGINYRDGSNYENVTTSNSTSFEDKMVDPIPSTKRHSGLLCIPETHHEMHPEINISEFPSSKDSPNSTESTIIQTTNGCSTDSNLIHIEPTEYLSPVDPRLASHNNKFTSVAISPIKAPILSESTHSNLRDSNNTVPNIKVNSNSFEYKTQDLPVPLPTQLTASDSLNLGNVCTRDGINLTLSWLNQDKNQDKLILVGLFRYLGYVGRRSNMSSTLEFDGFSRFLS